jgi:hypothetical protein
MPVRAFQIHPADNVATLIDDAAAAGSVRLLRATGGNGEIDTREPVARGHKVALADIAAGGAIVKFGGRIGHATQPIARGAWVHLHNLASDLDERSGSLDLRTGAPTDTGSAYV